MARLRIIFLCTVLAITYGNAFACADSTLPLTLLKTIPGNYTSFYTDNLQNIYLVNAANQVKKIDNNYDSAAVYNDVKRFGDLYLLDAANPLKIIAYYKDFTTIVVLDRFLNTRNTIDLRSAGILQARAVTASYDNNYWVFDELDNKLKKIDDNGTVLQQTADFRLLFNEQYTPEKIIDYGGLLYLYDPANGWLIFDYYGGFKQRVQVTGWNDVQVTDRYLTGHNGATFYFANPKLLAIQQARVNIAASSAGRMLWAGNKLLVLTQQALLIYGYQ